MPQGTVATVNGRYYAMDRETRGALSAAIVEARGARFPDAENCHRAILCERRETNLNSCSASRLAIMPHFADWDALLFANLPGTEISEALLDPAFDVFRVPCRVFSASAGITEYSKPLAIMTAVP